MYFRPSKTTSRATLSERNITRGWTSAGAEYLRVKSPRNNSSISPSKEVTVARKIDPYTCSTSRLATRDRANRPSTFLRVYSKDLKRETKVSAAVDVALANVAALPQVSHDNSSRFRMGCPSLQGPQDLPRDCLGLYSQAGLQ